MIGKTQQIKDLNAQLAQANERVCALTAEKAGLADALVLAEEQIALLKKQLPESLESSLSEKTINKARDILTRAMARSKQITADAQQHLDELRAQAEAESEKLLTSAKADADALLKAAHDEADALKADAEAANSEAIALREGAEAAAEFSARLQRTRIREALAVLLQENNALLSDIRRQASALMSALCEATDRVLLSDAETDDCKTIFENSLSEALKAPHGDEKDGNRISGVVTLHSRAEFDALGDYGFRNNALLSRVVLPQDGVNELPASFFFGCSNLIEVSLPMRMASIGSYAFFSCARLQSILLPRELERIGEYAFSCCHTLSRLRIPGGVKEIGVAAFRNCECLTEVKLERDGCLVTLGSHAFQNCTQITGFTLPKGLTMLPTSLFYGCERLETMDIPANIKRMQSDVFGLCTSLRRVAFHNPDLVLEPGATTGLEHVQLSLSGKLFSWAEVTEETTLRKLIDSHDMMNNAMNAVQPVVEDVPLAQDTAGTVAEEKENQADTSTEETDKADSSQSTETPMDS